MSFCEQAAAERVKHVQERIEFPHAYRVYVPIIGPADVVYHELEFEDFEERQAFWAAVFARPEIHEWARHWKSITESSSGRELWNLVE